MGIWICVLSVGNLIHIVLLVIG